ncbi:hypothetical protein O3P69_016225 [Scylla paramamosain]|uniref:Peptidase S1 domain-containing protein n=1 Tax=Scylla paramamosain TaxID=85552 RepID=A0AAW0S9G5_SCYPA
MPGDEGHVNLWIVFMSVLGRPQWVSIEGGGSVQPLGTPAGGNCSDPRDHGAVEEWRRYEHFVGHCAGCHRQPPASRQPATAALSGPFRTPLQGGAVTLYPPGSCVSRSAYDSRELTSGMVCAGDLAGVADTCTGDSGGPLVCDSPGGQNSQRWRLSDRGERKLAFLFSRPQRQGGTMEGRGAEEG